MSEPADPDSWTLDAAYWEHLCYSAHAAYTYGVSRTGNDPRGAPGTLTWSASFYGQSPPVLGAKPHDGWLT